MILSDGDIWTEIHQGRLKIDPLIEGNIQPSSIDLRVSDQFLVFHPGRYSHIDVKKPMEDLTELVEAYEDAPFMLHPSEFVIASTIERIEIPNNIVGWLNGKSSLGRLGLLIHSTAGFFDAGFRGHATLELSNVSQLAITIYPGMPIGQMSFQRMTAAALNPYGSKASAKYQDQEGPTPSRYYKNFEKEEGELGGGSGRMWDHEG